MATTVSSRAEAPTSRGDRSRRGPLSKRLLLLDEADVVIVLVRRAGVRLGTFGLAESRELMKHDGEIEENMVVLVVLR